VEEKSKSRKKRSKKRSNRRFLDTFLGRQIYLYDPMVYRVLCPVDRAGEAPPAWLVERLCRLSDASAFKTTYFQENLENYKKHGLTGRKPLPIKQNLLLSIQKKRMKEALDYVRKNKAKIKAEEERVAKFLQERITQLETTG